MGTYEEVLIFFGGLGIVIGAFNLIASTIKNLVELRKPAKEKEESVEAMFDKMSKTLDAHTQRLDRDEQNIKDIAEGQRFICRSVKALLNHELHNGNSDEMQTSSEALDMWIINK